jgi:hypothetical protein
MASVNGVNKTSIGSGLAGQLPQGTCDARVKCMPDTYEASALATDSNISMGGTLPTNARIVDVILAYDALSTVTLNVGDSNDADRYLSAINASSAGISRADEVDGIDYVIGTNSGDNQIIIKTTGASSATGTIRVKVLYTLD